jgi:N-acetylmuramoyl-L-alanine amidase
MARIIIDAGHGGSARAGNSSAYGSRGPSGLLEKDVTLDIARHVVARLGNGATLTRTGDNNLPLGSRAASASRDGADVFVSIHANSGPPEMAGPETWIHPDATARSGALGGGIQRALERLAGRYGGSTESRRGPMAVLNPSVIGRRTAACLVEVDYLSNPHGERRLGDPRQRAAIGTAIAGAIQEYVGSPRFGGADLVPAPPYNPRDSADAARMLSAFDRDLSEWVQGVPPEAHAIFPHAAICKLTMYLSNGSSFVGTGFYIGRDRILTAGHCLHFPGQAAFQRIRVERALGAQMSIPAFEVSGADGNFALHPRYNPSSFDTSWDLGMLRVPQAPLTGEFFDVDELTVSTEAGITACGYPGQEGTDSDNLQLCVGHNPRIQHLSRNYVQELFPNNEAFWTGTQAIGGISGSPVFAPMDSRLVAIAVVSAYNPQRRLYQMCSLTRGKIDSWVRRSDFPSTPWPPAYGGRSYAR